MFDDISKASDIIEMKELFDDYKAIADTLIRIKKIPEERRRPYVSDEDLDKHIKAMYDLIFTITIAMAALKDA